MNTKILLTIIALGFLTACGKDKYTTKPQLKFKNANTKVLNRNQQLRFTLEVTDSEGDIQDTLWVQEVVRNCPSAGFTTKYKVPEFTGTTNFNGEIDICYAYGINLGCPAIGPTCTNNRNDSATFRFWIKDKAKNVSDTISSSEIVIVQQ